MNNHGIEKEMAQYHRASSASVFPKIQAVGWANLSVLEIPLDVSSFPRDSVRELDK